MALVVDHGVNGGMGIAAISFFFLVVDAASDLPRHCCCCGFRLVGFSVKSCARLEDSDYRMPVCFQSLFLLNRNGFMFGVRRGEL